MIIAVIEKDNNVVDITYLISVFDKLINGLDNGNSKNNNSFDRNGSPGESISAPPPEKKF